MDLNNMNTDSQDSGEPDPPGTSGFPDKKANALIKKAKSPIGSPSSPGMLHAKKKLRAFSIQKKAVMSTPLTIPKPMTSGSTTVLIGKLSGVKVTPKPEPDPDVKKPPKPPKPGLSRRLCQENYTEIQKKNIAEIEDMKRKMELVELGIPLGLICPTSSNVQAMPTKAMPPIKSFLDPAKVDDLIRQAKKAKAEGKGFKFELSKFLPDYDNPFQRKKDKDEEDDKKDTKEQPRKESKWKTDRYEFKRHNDHRKKDDISKYRDRSKDSKEKRDDKKEGSTKEGDRMKDKSAKDVKETDVNLNDYLVCDSWSLDTEEKTNSESPKIMNKVLKATASIPLPEDKPRGEKYKEIIGKYTESKDVGEKSIATNVPTKVEKLQPVMDSFKYELDSNEDEVEALDIFDEDTEINKYANPTIKKNKPFESPVSLKLYDFDQEPTTADDENFLESVINEIKQEDMSDISQDKGLVEYDMSPTKDEEEVVNRSNDRESVTPELDDRMRDLRKQSYSDGYRSSESGYKSRESGYKSDRSDSFRLSVEKELDEALERQMSKSTVDSLETWSFILKICQPLLFRHDKNKCYRETHTAPKLWYTENPRRCACVKDRAIVYDELETCKMPLVDRVYGIDQILEAPLPSTQQWYPRRGWAPPTLESEWETEEPPAPRTPRHEDLYLDREYQRFMEAVWPEASDKPDTPPNLTPVKESRKKKKSDDGEKERKVKKMKLSSEGWSQESEVEEDTEKSKKSKEKARKRKLSTTIAEVDSDDVKKRKRTAKRKVNKKMKAKEAKRRRLNKKLRKLKEKTKKKKLKEKSDAESEDEKEKKKEKKVKKRKQLKQKKAQKKKARAKSTSSSSSSSESSSESSSDEKKKKKIEKKKKKKEKKRKQSSDSSQSEELFDVNILKNIKTERETDDEKRMEFSPRSKGERPREIINVKELQNDFVGNNIHIKQEKVDQKEKADEREKEKEIDKEVTPEVESVTTPIKETDEKEFKEPEQQPPSPQHDIQPTPKSQPSPVPKTQPSPPLSTPQSIEPPEETSQCSSQESMSKDQYEKDDSHLRPSSQNSNYSFNDVIASHAYQKGEEITTVGYQKDSMPAECEDEYQKEEYLPADYELYEQMAMAYQSDVASQQSTSLVQESDSQRIETVVGSRLGEIKCDWRPGDRPAPPPSHRPSRWGLKPSEVNIVLTGHDNYPASRAPPPAQTVYKIESIANRSADNNTSMSYDEAYMDMYGASDRLQYGDCFSTTPAPTPATPAISSKDPRRSKLDDRIDLALKNTVLGDVAKEDKVEEDKETPDKGILVSKQPRRKRVRFADGYAPGQDSDTEAPPKKKKKSRRLGCPWPCPASHPDHVPLWDALPPPPPPASPPPPAASAPPSAALLAALRRRGGEGGIADVMQRLAQRQMKFEPNSLPPFMPPEPPPGMINFHPTL